MTISQSNLVFATRYYRLLRAWVQHNEAHRRQVGRGAPDIQTSLVDFIAQYEDVA